ncbi:CRE-CDTL-7 protein [Caenorhabditis remanei]|uniref:[RNA-polymerase]-subunit kinase n=1 Tax=Caenorhabditis remanei TaxID=31234 RepID=E3MD21_CAERE|nr:CRE-CDTL-7 protein [Caenorhabditis remanei]
MEISPGSSSHERDKKGSHGHREHRERTRSHSGSPSRFYGKEKRGGSRQGNRGRDRESRDSVSPQYKQQRGWSSPNNFRKGGGGGRDRSRNDSSRKKSKERRRRDKRSRSRSRHRSPRRSGSSKKSKKRNSSGGSSSSDLMDTSLIGEIKKKHGADIGSSKNKKKRSTRRKRNRNSSSSSTSSGEVPEPIILSSNGMNLNALPPPTTFNPAFPPMFSQPPPPPPPGTFMTPPPRPPPPPFGMPPPMIESHFCATASVSISSIPPPPPQILDGASSSRRDALPLPPESRRIATRPVIITRRGVTTNRPSDSDSWYKTNLTHYEMLDQIGEGTYGQVYKAVNKITGTFHFILYPRNSKFTGEQVALKRVRLENEKEGFPITAIREIKILRQLHHKNIVRLIDIVIDDISMDELKRTRANFYLVFEYVDHDLIGLLESKELVDFNKDQICSLFKQLLEGLAYIHNTGFLHRDIKCSNILVNNKGELKIADLGLARLWQKESRLYTNRVITLWYRPPELLLGDERYGPAIDVWSAGCMLGELFTRKPLFNGSNEVVQMELISKVCGSPNPDSWPELTELQGWVTFKQRRSFPRKIREEFEHIMPREAVDLLDKMLTLNPERRISAKDALLHPWIRNLEHTNVQQLQLPQHQDCHEMWSKKQKRSARLGRQAEGSSGSGHSMRATSHPRAAPPTVATATSNASSSKTNGTSNNHQHASSVPPVPAVHQVQLPHPSASSTHNNHHPVHQQYQPVFFK